MKNNKKEEKEINYNVVTRNLITKETKITNMKGYDLKLSKNSKKAITPFIPKDAENEIDPNKVIDSDNRVEVNGNVYPYRAIGYLSINDGADRGTAFLIADNVAVTAAHCVYGCDYIQIFPGSSVNSHPYGEIWITSYTYPQEYANSGDRNYDWAIIVLDSNIGNRTGWLGLRQYYDYEYCVGLDVTLSGYSADLGYNQYASAGVITAATDTILEYDCDMTGGASGSPVYDSEYFAIAVNTAEYVDPNLKANLGSRVNEFFYNTAMDVVNNN